MKTEKEYAQMWGDFKNFLRSEIGWYETDNYKPMTAIQFIESYGNKMTDKFKSFMKTNVQLVSRQCDSYSIYFVGESIPDTKISPVS